jgi:hypothetical protein
MRVGPVLGRFDAAAIARVLAEAGVLRALHRKGFGNTRVAVESEGHALPHVLVMGDKGTGPVLLLDACLGEARVREDFFRERGFATDRAMEFAVVHWLREQDPTVPFSRHRPALPLQEHPGLGVLRSAFRAIVRMARELDKDGVANVPKFFHDAVIFFRSRLFLFLDGREQGRFEQLVETLADLSMGDASLALVAAAVRDPHSRAVGWLPGYQVFPISTAMTAYLHSPTYASEVERGRQEARYILDRAALERARGALKT